MAIKTIAKAAGMAALLCSTAANAAIVVSYTPGDAVYTPAPVTDVIFDFESPTPEFTGGSVVTGTIAGVHTAPLGSTGFYASTGPADGSPGILDLSGVVGDLQDISFIWGSVDFANVLSVLDASDNVIFSLTGTQLLDLGAPGGLPYTAEELNPIVNIRFTGTDLGLAKKLRFETPRNSFEIDNVAINAVPEPATWAFMIFGFGAIGTAMRRRKSVKTSVSYA